MGIDSIHQQQWVGSSVRNTSTIFVCRKRLLFCTALACLVLRTRWAGKRIRRADTRIICRVTAKRYQRRNPVPICSSNPASDKGVARNLEYHAVCACSSGCETRCDSISLPMASHRRITRKKSSFFFFLSSASSVPPRLPAVLCLSALSLSGGLSFVGPVVLSYTASPESFDPARFLGIREQAQSHWPRRQ